MIVRSGVTVSCPVTLGKRKRPYLTIRSYGSPNWASPNYCLLSCDIMQHCVIRRARPTNSKLTVVPSFSLKRKSKCIPVNHENPTEQWLFSRVSLFRALWGAKKKDSHYRASPYGSPNWASPSYRLLSCDIMQHCVIRRVRPTNSKLTVRLRSKQWSVELMSLSVRAHKCYWKRKKQSFSELLYVLIQQFRTVIFYMFENCSVLLSVRR